MANHKSAQKRIKQNKVRNLRNRAHKSTYRTEIKKFMSLLDTSQAAAAKERLSAIYRIIDKACTKKILSKNGAARKKSRIALKINAMLAKN